MPVGRLPPAVVTLAEELGNVSRACRLVGVHRSSYYRLKKQVVEWSGPGFVDA
jgi:hypothetical protein